jgi:tetratricopeptide (TPR) repeat protein
VADRLALAALAGADVSTLVRDLEAAAHDPDLAPLAAAAAAALPSASGVRPEITPVGSPRSRAALRLGRKLGTGPAPTAAADGGLREATAALVAEGGSAAGAALTIELDLAEGKAAAVAQSLEKWGGAGGDIAPLLAAGLVAEVAGDVDAARGAYERASAAEIVHEGAARALAALLEPAEIPGLLAEIAASVGEGPRQAILFIEASLRLLRLGAESEAETVLTRATQADPSLPFAHNLIERLARGRGDRDALVDCLRARREASDDPIERAYDFVREALLVSDAEEGAASTTLLEQALQGQPDDVALRELYERMAPELPADRASWREQRASRATGTEATSLALEAALDFERSGDVAAAAKCIKLAADRSAGAPAEGDVLLVPIYAHRYGVAGHGTAELVDALLPLARAAEDPHERREIYERLAELDELGRGDVASGVLWRRTILEEDPSHLPTLRRIETALMRENRVDELEPIALEIARALGVGPEMIAHAALSARLRSRVAWDESLEAVRLAYAHEPRGPWVLRQMAAHARAKGEAALALEVDRQLLARTERPAEIAALAIRAARGATGLGDNDLAVTLLVQASKANPAHLLARLDLANALHARGDAEGAATQLEAAAECAVTPSWKIALDAQAAALWHDEVGDRDRARQAFERVIVADPSHDEAFERLRSIYVAVDARAELAELLERRLDSISDPRERVEMEVMRGRALAQVGEHASAKRALAAALEASPDHVDALGAFAELCVAEEDWTGAEQALIRLARLAAGPDKQIEVYLRLGELYDVHVPNPERAELAYGEILKRKPGHAGARERLVQLFMRQGDYGRAIEEQNVLVASAEQPDDKAQRTVELAGILEAMGDTKKAEATLVAGRKAYPKSSVALEALVALYQRIGQQQAGAMLLDRAVADARRALGTGRFEGYLFATLAVAASLRGKNDAGLVCRAVVESLEGTASDEPVIVQGAGERAGNADLDDLVAPELLSPAFRDLLMRTGSMLDTAIPYDPASIRATPLPPPSASIGEEVRDIAIGYGIHRIEILVSGVLGHVAVAGSAHPPTIVLGQALLTTDQPDVRTYLIHRAMKVIQANAVVFARTAPIDLWPLLAAYLKCFTPGWNPQGVDATRLTNFYGRLSRAVPAGLPHDTGALAAEIIGSIGNRAPTLNTAVNGWGDRCALLALGDPSVALTAIAWAGGHTNAPPPPGKERLTWVGRNAEAREIVLFAVSDAYVDARSRIGIGD